MFKLSIDFLSNNRGFRMGMEFTELDSTVRYKIFFM